MGKTKEYPSDCNTNANIDKEADSLFTFPEAPVKVFQKLHRCFQNYLMTSDPVFWMIYTLPGTSS
jgi:hypothetical protein